MIATLYRFTVYRTDLTQAVVKRWKDCESNGQKWRYCTSISDSWTPRFAGINLAFWYSKIGVGKIWCSSSSWKLSSPLEKLGSLVFKSLPGSEVVAVPRPRSSWSSWSPHVLTLSLFSWLDSQWIYARAQLEFQEPTDVNARFYFEAEKTKIAKARR